MTRRKTTVYLDEDLLRGARVVAARSGLKDSDVFDAALRAYLGMEALESAWGRSELSPEEALEIAYSEVHQDR